MKTDHARPFVAIRGWLRAGLLKHLSPTASRVLFLMVDYCGTDGFSYPSAKTLSEHTGHSRKVVYTALKELVAIGCLERAGQIRWSSHNQPGPLMYAIRGCGDRDAERLRRMTARKDRRGDAARFVKVSQTQEHLHGSRCSYGCPQGVPENALRGVPENGLKGVPNAGTLRAFGAEHSEQSLLQSTPPSPPTGGTSLSGGPATEAVCSHAPGNGQNGNHRTVSKMEKDRENVRQFFEAEKTLGKGLKPLPEYLDWFPKQYDRAMLAAVYREVGAARQDEG